MYTVQDQVQPDAPSLRRSTWTVCDSGVTSVLWSHIGTLMCLLAAEPRSIAGLLFLLSVSLWNDFGDPVFDGVGLAGFKSRANIVLLA